MATKTLEVTEVEERALRTALEEAWDETREYILVDGPDEEAQQEFEAVRSLYKKLTGDELGGL